MDIKVTAEEKEYIENGIKPAPDDVPLSFNELFAKYLKLKRITQEELSARSGVSVTTISRMCRKNPSENQYKIETIMACIIGMHLDFSVSFLLLRKANYALSEDSKRDRAYSRILKLHYGCSVIQVNTFLRCLGIEELVSDSKVQNPHEKKK